MKINEFDRKNMVEYMVDCDFRNPCGVLIEEINKCPICKKIIKPIKKYGEVYRDNNSKEYLVIHYICNGCFNNFIVQYSKNKENAYGYSIFEKIDYIAPNTFEEKYFSECIETNYSNFVRIYNQSLEAEHNKLDEIAGMGYRKALEFLIKEFLIKEKPDQKDDIEEWRLGKCINELVDNKELKTVASRATWLGNDQVHYLKKYKDRDINDLKCLIEIAVRWIETIYLIRKAEEIEKK